MDVWIIIGSVIVKMIIIIIIVCIRLSAYIENRNRLRSEYGSQVFVIETSRDHISQLVENEQQPPDGILPQSDDPPPYHVVEQSPPEYLTAVSTPVKN
jgi:hypothetical protein